MKSTIPLLAAALLAVAGSAQIPDNLVVEGVPAISPEVRADAGRYLEFRAAAFQGWHPVRREMLISTRFADAMQLHHVRAPGGARRQLTFTPEPVGGGKFRPGTGDSIVFSQDRGGSEFHQLYRQDLADGRITLLTDGKSRNTGAAWARSGKLLAFASTRRTGRDNDIWTVSPDAPATARLVHEVNGGGWSVLDWSHDEARLLLGEYVSINESHLHILDLRNGRRTPLTPAGAKGVAYRHARFAQDDRTVFATTDRDSEFQRLVELELNGVTRRVLTAGLNWDVEEFELSPDGRTIAYISNEDGVGVLHLLDAKKGRELKVPKLPLGIPNHLQWHGNGRDLGFDFTSARSPNDAFSVDVKTLEVTRWTESETGGLDPRQFVEPELVKLKSFDGLAISAFVYRPDPKKFPGQRPSIISIHGGPEGQSRPIFQSRNNYYLNELGVAVIYPNVRGSTGYGKSFVALDNGFKREDSVRDIAAVLDFIQRDAALDAGRVAVSGGSYGGYMSLACMTHYAGRLRCGIDVVGISNFRTFLKNTQDYRRDLRRVEYGDERDGKMAEFLERISPTTNVRQITKPLFVIQGLNDPRVPVTEAEQMVRAVRDNGGTAWYLMAKDEGHGFGKKRNVDFQFFATILFYREFLLK